MASNDFFWFLSRSIDVLREESHENYENLALELKGVRARVSCGKKHTVYFDDMNLIICDDISHFDIEARFDDFTIIDLVDGRCSILDAVLSERLKIQGKVSILYKFIVAMNSYLNGALRSPGFLPLLSQYRQSLRRDRTIAI